MPLTARAGMIVADRIERPVACIVEAGCAEALEFGRRCGDAGIQVHEIREDVTAVWYTHLDRRWRRRPLTIAGMTRRPALFCLEQLAWQFGMRVTQHGVHGRPGSLGYAGPGSVCLTHPADEDPATLYSWIIAPAREPDLTAL